MKQGDQELRDEPSVLGGEESKDFGMTRGKAFAEVGGQVRELPIERPIIGFFDITVLVSWCLGACLLRGCKQWHQERIATRVTLEVVRNLVTDRWWSEEGDPKQRFFFLINAALVITTVAVM